jgi:hypothetical protein
MNKSFLFAVIVLLWSGQALYFGITAKPFCFDIEEEPGKTIKFYY